MSASEPRRVLVTGVAGFVGFHLARRLLREGASVLGVDNLNAYYDPGLKRARLALLEGRTGFSSVVADIADHSGTLRLFEQFRPTEVAHLAAQAGVRHSLEEPRSYVSANLDGFVAMLEACRRVPVEHFLYASSSSVYGDSAKLPVAEDDDADHPNSLYAATKRSGELMAEAYARLFGIPATGVRLFTVYGPWGRPDMAYWRFTEAIFAGREIEVFNEGRMSRDFTFVGDAVEALLRLLPRPPARSAGPPHAIYNVGNQSASELGALVETIARHVGRPARLVYRPMQPGDVVTTLADVGKLAARTGFRPSTSLEEGIGRFVAWFRGRYEAPGVSPPDKASRIRP